MPCFIWCSTLNDTHTHTYHALNSVRRSTNWNRINGRTTRREPKETENETIPQPQQRRLMVYRDDAIESEKHNHQPSLHFRCRLRISNKNRSNEANDYRAINLFGWIYSVFLVVDVDNDTTSRGRDRVKRERVCVCLRRWETFQFRVVCTNTDIFICKTIFVRDYILFLFVHFITIGIMHIIVCWLLLSAVWPLLCLSHIHPIHSFLIRTAYGLRSRVPIHSFHFIFSFLLLLLRLMIPMLCALKMVYF